MEVVVGVVAVIVVVNVAVVVVVIVGVAVDVVVAVVAFDAIVVAGKHPRSLLSIQISIEHIALFILHTKLKRVVRAERLVFYNCEAQLVATLVIFLFRYA